MPTFGQSGTIASSNNDNVIQDCNVPKIEYSNDDYVFAKYIIDDIRRNQRLPLNIKPDDVFHAIEHKTPWFYEHYTDATIDDQLIYDLSLVPRMNASIDGNGKFVLKTNELLLPSAVHAIWGMFYVNDSDFAFTSAISLSQWKLESILINSYGGAGYAYGVDTYMACLYCSNTLNSIGKEPVAYKFNKLTHILQLLDNGDRCGKVVCEVSRCLQPSVLYRDEHYRDFIIAHVLLAKADQLNFAGATTPGDTQINVNVLTDRANKLIEEVEKYCEADNDSDFFIIKT